MNQLQSMLVPLQTLSGWPEAPNPTVLESLGLLIGFPALAFIIVFAIAKIGNVVQAKSAPTEVTDSVWVGGRDKPELESGTTTDAATTGESAESGGGAGARW